MNKENLFYRAEMNYVVFGISQLVNLTLLKVTNFLKLNNFTLKWQNKKEHHFSSKSPHLEYFTISLMSKQFVWKSIILSVCNN